jgi:RNA polymerase sigma-70 factor, ECF subfamily
VSSSGLGNDELAGIYAMFGHLVLRRCQRILRDDALAEDAMQEVFVRLWRYCDSFRAAESKVCWLYRVAERCCFDRLAQRRRRAEVALEGELQLSDDGQTGSLEQWDLIAQVLNTFDDNLKQIAVLYFLDGLTQEEIAEETRCSRGTVVKRLTLLRKRAAAVFARLRREGATA